MSAAKENKYVIIGGTFKSGTSSLYTYLNQHSQIHGSSIKETGFFVPARYNRSIENIENYLDYFKGAHPDAWLLEASPGYLYGGEKIANEIKSSLGEDVKLVFLFRDPVKRFVSFYKMLKDANVENVATLVSDRNLSIDQYFDECLNYNKADKIDEDVDFILNGLKDGCYADYLSSWYKTIGADNIKIVFFDELGSNPDHVCEEICDWLNIDKNEVGDFNFRKVNQHRSHRSGFIKKVAQYINYRFESFFRRNERLKSRLVGIYEKLNSKKNTSSEIKAESIQRIEAFYQEHTTKLRELLLEKGYSNLPDWLE